MFLPCRPLAWKPTDCDPQVNIVQINLLLTCSQARPLTSNCSRDPEVGIDTGYFLLFVCGHKDLDSCSSAIGHKTLKDHAVPNNPVVFPLLILF